MLSKIQPSITDTVPSVELLLRGFRLSDIQYSASTTVLKY